MFYPVNFLNVSPTSNETNNLLCDNFWTSSSCNFKKINITESIKVPTSDHVAEIVGRQGKYSQTI